MLFTLPVPSDMYADMHKIYRDKSVTHCILERPVASICVRANLYFRNLSVNR